MRRVTPISHEDELSLVEHLDELRARIVVSLSVFGVALALCFWQNHLLLELASAPLPAAPPCMRQRFLPWTAGDRQGRPERVLAPQRRLESIGSVLRE